MEDQVAGTAQDVTPQAFVVGGVLVGGYPEAAAVVVDQGAGHRVDACRVCTAARWAAPASSQWGPAGIDQIMLVGQLADAADVGEAELGPVHSLDTCTNIRSSTPDDVFAEELVSEYVRPDWPIRSAPEMPSEGSRDVSSGRRGCLRQTRAMEKTMINVETSTDQPHVTWTDFDGRAVTREFADADQAARFAERLGPVLEQARRDGYVFIEGAPEFDPDHPAAWHIAQGHVIDVLMRTFPGLEFEWTVSPAAESDPVPRAGSLTWRHAGPDSGLR